MTADDRKRLIEQEVSALKRLRSELDIPERLARLERLGDLYYDVDQFQHALNKYHDFRTLAGSSGLLSPAGAAAVRIKEAWCLYERGDLSRTAHFLEETEEEIEKLPVEESASLRAELNILYGYLEVKRSRYDEALARCETAFRLLQNRGDESVLAKMQICFGHVYFRTGEASRAREYYEDALASARRASDSRRQVQATINLALVCKEQSDNDHALYLLEQAKTILRSSGNFSYRGHVLLNMAVIHTHIGNLQLAEEAYHDALRIYQQTGQQQCAALAHIGISRIHMQRGRLKEAGAALTSTLKLCVDQGYLREEVLIRRDLGDRERSLGKPREALLLYREALTAAAPLGDDSEHSVQIGRRLGLTLLRLGEIDEAKEYLHRSMVTARRIGERHEEALLTCALGTLAAVERKWDDFGRMYRTGIDQLRRMGEKIELGKALVRHARLALERDRIDEGELGLEIAEGKKIFRESDMPVWQGKTSLVEAKLFARDGISGKWESALAEAERFFSTTSESRFIDQVDLLRRTLEEKVVDRSISGRNDLLAIHELLPALSGDFDLDHLLAELVARTGGDRGILLVFDDADGDPSERAVHGLTLEEARETIGTLRTLLDRCRRGGRPFLSTAVAKDRRMPAEAPADHGPVKSVLVVPFQTDGGIAGAIYLGRGEDRPSYGSRELDLVVGLVRSQRFVLSLLSSRKRELEEENVRLREQVSRASRFDEIVTQSRRIYDILDLVRKVAGTNVTVLIQGETGTGKQLIANALHSESPRSGRTLFNINCATLPEQLLESEMFGHAQGSFTGAHAEKTGLLVEAAGSTVFLDEIDKMNLRVQSKLLHVLEEKRIRPLGSNEYQDVDVRFICATNRDLTLEVKEGRFLEDLFYRLNVIKIDLPPLRERVEDVLLLANYFLRIFSAEMGKERVRLGDSAAQALVRHRWRGNVRELRSEMRRLVVLDEGGVVELEHLSPAIGGGAEKGRAVPAAGRVEGSLRSQVESFERELLRMHLERNGDNVSKTARALGISRWGLHKKLDKYGLR